MLIVRPNYKISLGMLAVFVALTPVAITGGDVLGIGVCLSGVALLAGIVIYQWQKTYFRLTDRDIVFGKGLTVSGENILNYTVFESKGRGEGYFSCLNVNLKFETPLPDSFLAYFEQRKWVKLSDDRREMFITLPEPSASAAKVTQAFARLQISKTANLKN